jgi:hypothetical protein
MDPGTTLNLNGICLYTKVEGVPYRVQAGDGPLFGGGTIVDDIVTDVDDGIADVTSPARLLGAAPNPFNPSTELRFELERSGAVTLEIYDVGGRRVRTLLDGAWRGAGEHAATWDGRDDRRRALSSGTYIGRLRAGGRIEETSLVLLK